MTVLELKKILDDHDDNMEVFVSLNHHLHIGRADSVGEMFVSGEFVGKENDMIASVLEISANLKR